jgi:hypothetical protein
MQYLFWKSPWLGEIWNEARMRKRTWKINQKEAKHKNYICYAWKSAFAACNTMPNVSRERKLEINIKRSRFNASTQLGLIYGLWHWLSCLFILAWRLGWLRKPWRLLMIAVCVDMKKLPKSLFACLNDLPPPGNGLPADDLTSKN